MSGDAAPAVGGRRLRSRVCIVLLYVLLGPPIGGIVVILIANAINLGADEDFHRRAMLTLIPFSYVPGILPALACGLFSTATLRLRGPASIVAMTLVGAAAGLGGAYLFSLTVASMLVAPLPWAFYGVFVSAGAVAAFVCAVLAERMIGSVRGG